MGDRLPPLFPHERTIAELEVRDPEPFSGNGIHLPDHERLFAIAFHVYRDGIPAVMDGDLDGFINAYLKALATNTWATKS